MEICKYRKKEVSTFLAYYRKGTEAAFPRVLFKIFLQETEEKRVTPEKSDNEVFLIKKIILINTRESDRKIRGKGGENEVKNKA